MPLWLLTDRRAGGLNFKAKDIGTSLLFLAPFQIILQASGI